MCDSPRVTAETNHFSYKLPRLDSLFSFSLSGSVRRFSVSLQDIKSMCIHFGAIFDLCKYLLGGAFKMLEENRADDV